MILWTLFYSFSKIGFFAIGGAYSFLPLVEKEVVDKYHWLAKEEFLEVLGMIKIFPGAISIKYATYTGYKIAGIPGALAANLGNFIAPVILVIVASGIYMKYKDSSELKGVFNMIQLVMMSMIIAVAFKLVSFRDLMQVKGILTVILSFFLFAFTKVHPTFIILGAGILGYFLK